MFTSVQKKKQNTQSIEGNILKSQDIFGKYQSIRLPEGNCYHYAYCPSLLFESTPL